MIMGAQSCLGKWILDYWVACQCQKGAALTGHLVGVGSGSKLILSRPCRVSQSIAVPVLQYSACHLADWSTAVAQLSPWAHAESPMLPM